MKDYRGDVIVSPAMLSSTGKEGVWWKRHLGGLNNPINAARVNSLSWRQRSATLSSRMGFAKGMMDSNSHSAPCISCISGALLASSFKPEIYVT